MNGKPGRVGAAALSSAVEDVLGAALDAAARARGGGEEEGMAHEGAALEHECPGSPGNGTGGTAGRSSGGRPNAWQNAVLPHLLSLQTLLPSESSMVFRALQLVHERRLTLLVGDKPSESSSRASGHAEAAQRWHDGGANEGLKVSQPRGGSSFAI